MRFLQAFGLSLVLVGVIVVASYAAPPASERSSSPYFRPNSLRSVPAADADLDAWYSSVLSGMRDRGSSGRGTQPPLFRPGRALQVDETYRALISYGREYAMAIRVTKGTDGRYSLQADERSFRVNGPAPRSFSHPLREDQWAALDRAVNAAGFWGTAQTAPAHSDDCTDIIIEGRRGTDYNAVSLGCESSNAARKFAPALSLFEQMSGWYPY